jgi:1-acyl-sn-glycerol-3-phosphate acyltransferase
LPVNGPLVLAPKHFSRWDPLVLGVLSLEPFWFMTNANQFVGVQGWFLRRLGAFPVDLNRPKLASFRLTIALLQAGKKLMLFPEGGIVRDQPVRSLKPGLARLVMQAEANLPSVAIPVVPIALHYSPGAVWRSDVTIQIAPPLYLKDFRPSVQSSVQPVDQPADQPHSNESEPPHSEPSSDGQRRDRQTAIALTQAIEQALFDRLNGLISQD